MSEKTKVAVIGLGNIGTVVASNLAKGKRPVIVADRTFEKAVKLAGKLGPLAAPREIADAIYEADIIVLAVWFNTIKELLKSEGPELQNKIIIDPSNPIAPDEKGGFVKIIGADESAGEILSGLYREVRSWRKHLVHWVPPPFPMPPSTNLKKRCCFTPQMMPALMPKSKR